MSEPINMRIRHYVRSDRDALVELWRRCDLVHGANNPLDDIEMKVAHDNGLFVGVYDTQVVGSIMVGYEGHRGWMNYLAVDPTFQRQGLGRELLSYCETYLRDVGCPKINLQVRSENATVLEFYERAGYVVDDVISMGKRLGHSSTTP